jgi:DnaD/phage-associated family protein
MSKSTLYRTIIRPLWEYYLIDLEEYEESKRKTQKPMNIIVYESPMNKHETEIKPLEKLRDWEKDYGSPAQLFGRKGGRPKKDEEEDPNRFKNETVGEDAPNRFKNKTVTVSEIKPNNYTNKLLILTNKPTNTSNNKSKYVSNAPAASTQQEGKQEEVNPLDRFGQNFNLTKYAKKELNELIKMHGPILVDEAVKRAVKGEANTPVGYITGTLKNWQKLGLKTPEEIEEHEIRYYEEKKARKKQKPVQALSARKEEKTMPSVLQMIQQQDEDFSELVISDEKKAAYLERLRLMHEKLEERKGNEGRP